MTYKSIFTISLFLTLYGCQHHDRFQQQLAVADTLMRTDAGSAFRMLCALDSQAVRMPKDLQMRHLLLRCNAQNKIDSRFTSDSLGLLLTRYFDDKGTPNQRMLAHYVLGRAYRNMNNFPLCPKKFQQGDSCRRHQCRRLRPLPAQHHLRTAGRSMLQDRQLR